ncbi:hypothetical protein EJF18_10007 [Clavispora lusitaniae]|uniref:Uncharacterized protein n=1 Tax=Clavispora lusitaniae TaxID=36911 RepID=A0ACD0WBT0_CLALS|nr:hypothetical protein E0198_001086 [Clavispora lusitaniae]QFZ24929.1 hypothetical protein EJF14_10007 [Clavispora lusitaniae]QFZ31767.1 hypothetical protein EJF16_10007 [Clavispora lusitaniae]QFZ37436.1 hypothetical protein EJF15_10007 [Clavispora lusitaniae]QFZ43120.1 hypothetical protein EJF18_10007 [Clavispora lusitaniae]
MSNQNPSPYYPSSQAARYHTIPPKTDVSNTNYQNSAQLLHQPIPPIVFNYDYRPASGPANHPYSSPLPVSEQQMRKTHVPNSIPLIFNPLGQAQRPFTQQNSYSIPYAPVSNPSPMYFMPQAPVYQHGRVVGEDRYIGSSTRPVVNDRYVSGSKLADGATNIPFQRVQTYQESHGMMPTNVTPLSVVTTDMNGSHSAGNPSPVENDVKNYIPTKTKKNSRPKINKIVSEKKKSKKTGLKKQRLDLCEHSNDEIFTKFSEVLAIKVDRVDIAKAYSYIIEDELEQKLFDLFVNKLTLFIDVFLPEDRFQKVISELALYDETRMILDSIFCLSSLIFQRMNPEAIDPLCPLKYYQRTVNSIRYHLSLPEVEYQESGILARCLISTNLLCIYELFFVAIDSTYIKGAGSILSSILSKWNKSESLLKVSPFYNTCFWAMFVCDLVLSLKLEARSTYSLEKMWRQMEPSFFQTFDEYPVESEEASVSEVTHSNFLVSRKTTTWWQHKIMLLLCDITEYLNASEVSTKHDFEANRRFDRWKSLNLQLEEFEKNMPVYLKPLIYKPASGDRLFPLIYFKDEQTAIVTLNYKLAKLTLHVALCRNTVGQNKELVQQEIKKYATNYREKLSKDVVGIMQTYDSNQKIWPVNIHALRQAAKYIDKNSPDFAELKQLIIKVANFSHAGLHIKSMVDEQADDK